MTTNKPMTGEQLDELMTVAVRMQRDAEVDCNYPSANFAYAVQVAVLELRGTRAVASALSAENAALKKYICDECYVENIRTGHHACAGHGMPSTPDTDAYLAEVRATAITDALEECSEYLITDCVMDRLGISYEDAELRSSGAIELDEALICVANQLRQEAAQ